MASAVEKKSCVKCPKGPGQVLCDGCERYFCVKHLTEHRQDLSQHMDDLTVAHDQFRHNLTGETADEHPHPLLLRVDRWELRSIERIRQVASEVRRRLTDLVPQLKRDIEESLRPLTDELRENRQAETFTESDLTKWRARLSELQEQVNQTSMIEIRHDEDEASRTHIPLIQLRVKQKRGRVPINDQIRRSTEGQTVAGGHGQGDALNQLYQPYAFDVDDDGSLFIADTENHRIVRWEPHATQGEIIAGGRERGNRADQLNEPLAMAIDRKNRSLIISDWGNRRVMRWPLDRRERNGICGEVIISNIYCFGLAIDDEGALYVSDHDKYEVRRYGRRDGRNGMIVAGGNGSGDALNQFNGARNIFVDDDHSIYLSDRDNHRVMKWMRGAREGVVVAGGRGEGNGLGQLSWPSGIFVDPIGSVYVADQFNHRVMRWRKGAREGEVIVGGDNPGSQSNQLSSPKSISIDDQGHLYVVDRGNHRIQRFDCQ